MPAPDFTLRNQYSRNTSLSKFHGNIIILFFFGRTENEQTIEFAKTFEEDKKIYDHANAIVLGISHKKEGVLRSFHQQLKLSFDILSDSKKTVIDLYGVKSGLGGPKRTTLIIDKQGVVFSIIDYEDVEEHRQEIHAELERLLETPS